MRLLQSILICIRIASFMGYGKLEGADTTQQKEALCWVKEAVDMK